MHPPVRITAPAAPPISTSDAKAHLRVTFASDDALIAALVEAAVAHLDGWTGILGRCLVTQTWRQHFTCWPANGCLQLPFPDVDPAEVEITYLDTLGDEVVVDDDLYEVLEGARGSIVQFRSAFAAPSLESDRARPIWVTFDVGYGDAEDVPASIHAAIKLIVGDLYENRENTVISEARVQALPIAADRLLAPYRRVGF